MKINFSRILLTLICLLFISALSGQRFKGAAITGLSTNQVDGDTQKDYKKLGLFSGVFVETDFTRVVGMKIELYYIGKGAKQQTGDFLEFKTTLHYVEMPFLLTIKPIKNVQIDLGFYASYLIDSKFEVYSGAIDDDQYDMNSFDIGYLASGIYYFVPRLGFNVRFGYSLVPIKSNPNWFNNNLCFGLVYRFNK